MSTIAVASKPQVHAGTLRRVFSFPVAVSALLAVLATVIVGDRFADPDMWWHLKMGQVIWTTHHIPTTDLFSYTTNHHVYIPHEWLSQLFIFSAYRLGGYSGLMLWLSGMTAAILIAGYALSALYSGNPKVALIGALVIFFFGTIGFSIRPQLVGYLLLIAELALVYLGRTRNEKWFFGLPALFAVWVNCHSSYSFGLLVLCVFFFSSLFEFQSGIIAGVRWTKERRRAISLAVVLSAAALFVNPIGGKLILYPIHVMLQAPVNLNAVAEWLPLRLNDARGIGFLVLIAGIPLLAATGSACLYLDEVLLLAVSGFEAAQHERLTFVFGIVVAPILTRLLSNQWSRYRTEEDHPAVNAILIAASAACAFLCFPSHASITRQIADSNPTRALAYVRNHNLHGPMFNEYVFGGYLIWAAPDYPVFVDGRGDIFEWTGVLSEYGRAVLLQENPEKLFDKYGISFCLLSQASPLKQVLPLLPDWKIVYSDEVSFVAVRSTGP